MDWAREMRGTISIANEVMLRSRKASTISGIVVLGAVLQIGQGNGWVSVLAFIAVLLVSVNIFGGFYVTRRMLNMFRKG